MSEGTSPVLRLEVAHHIAVVCSTGTVLSAGGDTARMHLGFHLEVMTPRTGDMVEAVHLSWRGAAPRSRSSERHRS
jgi:hypothetical protein